MKGGGRTADETNVRTAEADAAAGAVEVVDAEEVRVVRPAAAAQEVDHVDPPHLASSSRRPLVRVHDGPAFPSSLTSRCRRPSAATARRTIRGNKEIAPKIKACCVPASTCARSLSPYLNRIDGRENWLFVGNSFNFARRAEREAGAACVHEPRRRGFDFTGGSNRQLASRGSKCC